MKFLTDKFYDQENRIKNFLGAGNRLLALEKDQNIDDEIKRLFVNQFIEKIIEQNIISREAINSVNDKNPWSIDFPSWIGEFDEKKGKRFFVIGAEPHIHYKYLQTVYGFHDEKSVTAYIEDDHPIFSFLSQLLAEKFQLSKGEALNECYLTDLFPLSARRGNGLSVGSADKLQFLIGKNDNWIDIRRKYAKSNLAKEIKAVKPEIVITQGKEVFKEVLVALDIKGKVTELFVPSLKGKRQFIRKVQWNDTLIVSVPHIGSRRMRTFWRSNLEQIKKVFSEM